MKHLLIVSLMLMACSKELPLGTQHIGHIYTGKNGVYCPPYKTVTLTIWPGNPGWYSEYDGIRFDLRLPYAPGNFDKINDSLGVEWQ